MAAVTHPLEPLTADEIDSLSYMALKKRMKECGAGDSALTAKIEAEMAPGKSAGGKPALIRLYNEVVVPALGAEPIDGRDLDNVEFVKVDAHGIKDAVRGKVGGPAHKRPSIPGRASTKGSSLFAETSPCPR